MNANELADELDYCYGKEYPCPVSKEAATMLRKLDGQLAFRIDAVTKYQAWIKELEVSKQSWEIIAKGYSKTIEELQVEIEALKAKLNKYHLKEDLDRNLKLIYDKEIIK